MENPSLFKQVLKVFFRRFKKPSGAFKSYNFENYWKLRDYLDVLNVLDSSNYFYFTSNKSQIVELCEWVETRTSTGNPFAGATVTTTAGNVNYSSGYTDVMMHKLV